MLEFWVKAKVLVELDSVVCLLGVGETLETDFRVSFPGRQTVRELLSVTSTVNTEKTLVALGTHPLCAAPAAAPRCVSCSGLGSTSESP